MRTPLNAAIGFSDLLRSEIHGPVGKEAYLGYARDIHGSETHLLDIINEVLDMSRIEAGTMHLHESEFELAGLLEACVRMTTERAEAADVALKTTLPDGILKLHADNRLVRQIVINLLTNAIKFTEPGGTVTLSATVGDSGVCELVVEDTGIGIPEDHLDTVMEPFVQVDAGLSRKYEGTGLGLALVKSMVELHGASIRIESQLGAGTRVTVRFPAERVRVGEAG